LFLRLNQREEDDCCASDDAQTALAIRPSGELKLDSCTLPPYQYIKCIQPAYKKWCERTGFVSALPNDRRAAKEAKNNASAAEGSGQSKIDGHLRDIPAKPKIVKYSDAAFREAAIEWLIATDQVRLHLCDPK
jgi:hypothetical protein